MSVVTVLALLGGCACAPAARPAPMPEGSGCSGAGSALSDGRWFGVLSSGSTTDVARFDLVCLFMGTDALVAAVEDGLDPDNVFEMYVRNRSTGLRNVDICPGARWTATRDDNTLLNGSNPVRGVDVTPTQMLDRLGSAGLLVSLRVDGGCATRVWETYIS